MHVICLKYSCGDAKRGEESDKLKIEWRKSKQQGAAREGAHTVNWMIDYV